jgi:hypothetical protein
MLLRCAISMSAQFRRGRNSGLVAGLVAAAVASLTCLQRYWTAF